MVAAGCDLLPHGANSADQGLPRGSLRQASCACLKHTGQRRRGSLLRAVLVAAGGQGGYQYQLCTHAGQLLASVWEESWID